MNDPKIIPLRGAVLRVSENVRRRSRVLSVHSINSGSYYKTGGSSETLHWLFSPFTAKIFYLFCKTVSLSDLSIIKKQ